MLPGVLDASATAFAQSPMAQAGHWTGREWLRSNGLIVPSPGFQCGPWRWMAGAFFGESSSNRWLALQELLEYRFMPPSGLALKVCPLARCPAQTQTTCPFRELFYTVRTQVTWRTYPRCPNASFLGSTLNRRLLEVRVSCGQVQRFPTIKREAENGTAAQHHCNTLKITQAFSDPQFHDLEARRPKDLIFRILH